MPYVSYSPFYLTVKTLHQLSYTRPGKLYVFLLFCFHSLTVITATIKLKLTSMAGLSQSAALFQLPCPFPFLPPLSSLSLPLPFPSPLVLELLKTARGSTAESGRIEAHALYVASGGDPSRSHCGRQRCPCSKIFRFLISKRLTFVNC